VSSFEGVPANTRVNMIVADVHDVNTVYAVFNNHRSGDFKPYLMKSTNQGKSWTMIAGNLPERGSVFAVRQDHVDPNLLFAGTEFGCFFSNDAGKNWTKLAGLPTIAVYDIELQKRENDIVIATFGRGFYVLDNYTPLRSLSKEILDKEVHLFPIKDAQFYVQASPLGSRGNAYQGSSLWRADNPEYGATFSIYVKSVESSMKSKRQKDDKKKEKEKEAVTYPTFDQLRAENNEDKLKFIWIIRDQNGTEIKRISTSPKKGISRITWNFRTTSASPVSENNYGNTSSWGLMITPGTYSVEVHSVKDGVLNQVIEKTTFNVVNLNGDAPTSADTELSKFRDDISELRRLVDGSGTLMEEYEEKLKLMENAIRNYPGADLNLLSDIERLKNQFEGLKLYLDGDRLKSKYQVESSPSISNRLSNVYYSVYSNTRGVTETQRTNMALVKEEYADYRKQLDAVIVELKSI
jgi:hypothetical protein